MYLLEAFEDLVLCPDPNNLLTDVFQSNILDMLPVPLCHGMPERCFDMDTSDIARHHCVV